MRLEKFRVTNFRSVKDSGWVAIADQTALVGRNESGKSNLLRGLRSLKPPGALERLSVSSDFPAERSRLEYSDDLDVVNTSWSLSAAEREHLGAVFPRARHVTSVEIGRGFEPTRWVRFPDIPTAEAPVSQAKEILARVDAASGEPEEGLDDPGLRRSLQQLQEAIGRPSADLRAWAEGVREALGPLRSPVEIRLVQLPESARDAFAEIAELVDQVANDNEAEQAARDWVLEQLPAFLYLDDYAEIHGQQDLAAFLERRRQGQRQDGDLYFEKLLAVAGLDPTSMETLLHADHEARRQIVNRAGAVVTRKLRDLWQERALKVRFNLDGNHFNTLISDPNSLYDVEVNLNERSRGFRWFFSFYVTFAADAASGSMENMVLLLDEPGLYLHALGQRDLLSHFKADFPNQVVYTTHSPFMVPSSDVSSVRTVSICEEEGTTVANRPVGDEKTLFPILHSLGVEVARGLFDKGWHLAVSEITDYWYLRAVSDFVRGRAGAGLPKDLHVTPAGGCSRLPYMVALLAGEESRALALLSEPPVAGQVGASTDIAKLLPQGQIVSIAEAMERDGAADVEDLFDPELYDRFVRYCWRAELKERKLEVDATIPRMVERYEKALAAVDLEFERARPARLFLRGMGKNPTSVLPKTTRARFERLFEIIQERLAALRG